MYTVDAVDSRGATEDSRVCSEKTDGTSTEYGNTVSLFEAGEGDAAPSSGEDVRDEEVVDQGGLGGARVDRDGNQGVISKWDACVLGCD